MGRRGTLTEQILVVPGFGRRIVEAGVTADYPAVLGRGLVIHPRFGLRLRQPLGGWSTSLFPAETHGSAFGGAGPGRLSRAGRLFGAGCCGRRPRLGAGSGSSCFLRRGSGGRGSGFRGLRDPARLPTYGKIRKAAHRGQPVRNHESGAATTFFGRVGVGHRSTIHLARAGVVSRSVRGIAIRRARRASGGSPARRESTRLHHAA